MRTHHGHIAYLDGWRGLAISAVFFGHFVSKAHYWWIGMYGVQLFFALSGFLMCNILFFKKTTLPDFFIRRLIRVGPTFLLFVLSVTLYAATIQPIRYIPSTTEVISTLLFLRSYFPSDVGILNDNWPIGHLWSLNVEEHSYIFLALCSFVAQQVKREWFTAMILLSATVAAFIFSVHHFLHPTTRGTSAHMLSEAAALGILASVTLNYITRKWFSDLSKKIHPLLPIISLAIAFACFTDHFRWRGLDVLVAPLLIAFSITYLERAPNWLIAILSSEPLRWIGRVSFSLYIWQQPFHFAVCHYGMNAWLGTVLAIALGLLSFYTFENPIRIWLTHAWERSRPVSDAFAEQDGALGLK